MDHEIISKLHASCSLKQMLCAILYKHAKNPSVIEQPSSAKNKKHWQMTIDLPSGCGFNSVIVNETMVVQNDRIHFQVTGTIGQSSLTASIDYIEMNGVDINTKIRVQFDETMSQLIRTILKEFTVVYFNANQKELIDCAVHELYKK